MLIGAMVAKHGIEFVNAMVSLVFFTCVMKLWCAVSTLSMKIASS